ncbi:hypothetical protein B0H34DRAFT_674692 [Crassisporium funariophilum]|nr:hypothetical protein B0H34DRAFT_674692 [Crassisporium funariophilum]
MSAAQAYNAPAWQTEELQDEWVDLEPDEGDGEGDLSYGTQSVSLTVPLSTHIHTNTEFEHDATPSTNNTYAVGTFLVREDVANAPLLPKTPGRNKKGLIKDFFTPLPLERMFDPPSPPERPESEGRIANRSPLSRSLSQGSANPNEEQEEDDEIIETDMPNMNSFHGRKASLACQFTFSAPRNTSSRPSGLSSTPLPQAQSTPNPPFAPSTVAPMTDPRLRLFQFQYDTYTREHLSALVDSIAINTPSGTGTTATPTSFTNGLSRVSEVTGTAANMSHIRSTKRLKLSPSSDFYGEGAGSQATVSRPKIYGKDYVGESRSLMQQIKQARDYSTISTVASGQQDSPSISNNEILEQSYGRKSKTHINSPPASLRRPSFLAVPEQTSNKSSSSPSNGTMPSKPNSYSSTSYRAKAAALMEQIKTDVKRQKRVFSGESETSHVTTHVEESTNSFTRSSSGSIKFNVDGKENHRHSHSTTSTHRRTSSSKSNTTRSRASPRKAHKRIGEDADLADNLSHMSIHVQRPIVNITLIPSSNPPIPNIQRDFAYPNTLAPPSYPSSSVRLNTNEDLNRFVSSSTASGTTLTAGSAPSFTKHAGPAHIRTIAPGDLPPLPERFGDMLFDKVMMKWVKSTAQAAMQHDKSVNQSAEVSDDPFGDIESLRDDSRTEDELEQEQEQTTRQLVEPHVGTTEMSIIQEQSEVDDEEEMELTSFSTDASAHVVNIMTGVDTDGYDDDDETTDSQEDDDLHTATQGEINDIDFDSDFEDSPPQNNHSITATAGPSSPGRLAPPAVPVATFSTPSRAQSGSTGGTPVIKSALKSGGATPTSALRNAHRYSTPLHRKSHRRSVSFSDGKRDGPIRATATPGGTTVQSVRSKRINDMMNALEDSDLDENDSPSKASSSGRPEELQPLTARHPSSSATAGGSKAGSPRRVFSRSYTHRPSPGSQSLAKANGTFLTECSFGVAHDRLVEVITDVQPFEPHWEELSSIDLSNAKLESVARLKEFLPRLDALVLNRNQLSWLSGIPGSVRTLSVAFNCLAGITSYSHLLNLENLDISHNEVDSLRQLDCLRHLRELKADGNRITSIDGLQRMDGLVKLSLQGNLIRSIELPQYRWTRLEMLNVSHNRLDSIQGLSSLQSLIALNMDINSLSELRVSGTMARLRILRVSGNRLQNLDVGAMPNLRTLYADNNALASLVKVDRLTKLENLSLRNQSGRGLLLTRDVRDVKRLYLSGNPLNANFLEEPCYNLVYLELAACRLTALPEGMAKLLPNLRVLNLNYNFLEDVRPLEGLTRLQKLTIIGSRLKNTKPLIRLLGQMPNAEMLDFRMNPCTLGWYLPLLVRDVPGALQPSEGGRAKGEEGKAWQELDSKFRRDLPDSAYIGRLAYRGLIMRGCARVRLLDGVGVSEKERMKAQELLQGILGRRR